MAETNNLPALSPQALTGEVEVKETSDALPVLRHSQEKSKYETLSGPSGAHRRGGSKRHSPDLSSPRALIGEVKMQGASDALPALRRPQEKQK